MSRLIICFVMVLVWVVPAMGADGDRPADAQWTIYCSSFAGPMRVQQAKSARESLSKSTQMKNWHVIHQQEESTLYYGFYRNVSLEIDDAKLKKDAQQAHDDLKRLKGLEDGAQQKLFTMIGFVPLPQPGGEGPPEWDLSKLPAEKYWTLFVGVYKENPDRKKAAVQAVKTLRDEGKEAYYFHDSSASLICIGAWPRSAIKEQTSDAAAVDVNDPDVEVRAYNVPLPRNVPREFMTSEGKKVKVFAPNIEVVDPTLQSAMDRYPDFLTNGRWLGRETKDPTTGKTKVIGHRSQLLIIPRQGRAAGDQPPREVERTIRQLAPEPAKSSNKGKLKSLDED